MQMIHRFGSGESEEYFEHYLALLKEYPKAGNTVWFASHYGFPPLEKHGQEGVRLAKIAEKFRENHIGVSLQISNTLGHGEYMSSQDCTGLVYDGSPAENMVGPDGTKANYCFCWNGRHFRDYTKKAATAYAALHPDCIWFDDDLRPNHHAPVPFGCFCENCIAAFNKKYSPAKPFTREKLVEEFLYGDLKVRENWIYFVREGLYSFTYEICSAVHEALPDCEFGYQYCANGAYTGRGFDYILNAMKAANGKDPRTRPGGGAYSDHNPGEFLSKASFLSWANALLPQYVKCKCPEIENLPFEAYEKSPAGCAFECAYYMAGGATDMSFSMMMHENERREYYEEMLRLLSASDKYRRRLAAENARTVAAGMRFFISDYAWQRRLNKATDESFFTLKDEHSWEADYWIRDGLPLTFEDAENDVILLHPETVKPISREEYEKLLGENVFADGESIALLAKKFGEKAFEEIGAVAREIDGADAGKFEERLLPHATRPEWLNTWKNSFFTAGRNTVYRLIAAADAADRMEVLSTYRTARNIAAYERGEYPYGVAAAVVTTKKGAKWAIFGNAPWKGVMSFGRREQLANAADYICGEKLCARVKTMQQCALLPRKDENGKTACVSIANVMPGESGEYVLAVRNPRGEKFTLMRQGSDEEIALSAEKTLTAGGNEEYVLKLPSVPAYTVCTVFID